MSIEEDFDVLAAERLQGEDEEDTSLLQSMLEEGAEYLASFKWCVAIKQKFFGWGAGGICAVFLFEIENSASPDDSLLWVIVGDVPPAYLVAGDGPANPLAALATYVDLMQEWVDAAKGGRSVVGLVPVNVPATRENARLLASRLEYIREAFLDVSDEE
jgi:hypothetical protein